MKKLWFIIVLVLAGLSLVAAELSFIGTTSSTQTLFSVSIAVTVILFILAVVLLRKNKLYTLVPMVMTLIVTVVLKEYIGTLDSTLVATEYEVLSLVLFIVYIASLVFSLKDGYKVTTIISIVYLTLELFVQFKCLYGVTLLTSITDSGEIDGILGLTYAMLALYGAQLAYMITLLPFKAKPVVVKEEVKAEEAVVEENNSTEEVKAEIVSE